MLMVKTQSHNCSCSPDIQGKINHRHTLNLLVNSEMLDTAKFFPSRNTDTGMPIPRSKMVRKPTIRPPFIELWIGWKLVSFSWRRTLLTSTFHDEKVVIDPQTPVVSKV